MPIIKMTIADDNETLTNPVRCAECDELAYTLFFDLQDASLNAPGHRKSMTQLYAKCINHLLFAETTLTDVIELD